MSVGPRVVPLKFRKNQHLAWYWEHFGAKWWIFATCYGYQGCYTLPKNKIMPRKLFLLCLLSGVSSSVLLFLDVYVRDRSSIKTSIAFLSSVRGARGFPASSKRVPSEIKLCKSWILHYFLAHFAHLFPTGFPTALPRCYEAAKQFFSTVAGENSVTCSVGFSEN